MKLVFLLSFFALLSACTSTPKNERRNNMNDDVYSERSERNEAQRPYSRLRTGQANRPANNSGAANSTAQAVEPDMAVDYLGLQKFLKLDRGYNNLGYSERMFNTCEVGYGYSSTHDCEKRFFVVSHFQLKCRDSEGTISQILTAADLQPISRRQVNWTLKDAAGTLMTDSEGYGQIAMVSAKSMRMERLKLSIDNDFLYLKAGELKQMITPKNWCN